MRVCEVGNRQFFARGMRCVFIKNAYIAKLRQPLVPIPHFVSKRRLVAQFVVEANFNNAVNIAQAFRQLVVRMVLQTPLKSADDLLARQARAAWATNGQDKRKTELSVVVGVELLNMRELFGCAVRQSCCTLFVGRFGCQAFAHHRLAG